MFLRVAFPAQLESQKVTPACLPWYLLNFSDMFGGRWLLPEASSPSLILWQPPKNSATLLDNA